MLRITCTFLKTVEHGVVCSVNKDLPVRGIAVCLEKMADFVRHRAERIRHALESSVGACPSHPKRTFSCKRKTLGTHGIEAVQSLSRVWLHET